MKYLIRLRDLTTNFNAVDAINLSNEMHEAEQKGYQCCDAEERLWLRLSRRIEKERFPA